MTLWATLGDVALDRLVAPYNLGAQDGHEFSVLKVMRGKPRLQAIGPELQELSFTVKLHRALQGDLDQVLVRLRELIGKGESVPLVLQGRQWGIYADRYVIKALRHEVLQYSPDTGFWEVDVSLTLLEAPDPPSLQVVRRPRPAPGLRQPGKAASPEVRTERRTNKDGVSFTFIPKAGR